MLVTAVMSQHFDVFKLLMETVGQIMLGRQACVYNNALLLLLEEGDDRFLKYALQDEGVQASLVAARKLACGLCIEIFGTLDTRL